MLWRIQSKNRQFITFILPEGAEVMKLYVNGKDTRRTLSKDSRHLAVSLSQSTEVSEEVTIEVVYKQKLLGDDKSMGWLGSYAVETPVTEEKIPTLRLTWTLYVPRGYYYSGFGGNLRRLFMHKTVWIWGKSLLTNSQEDYNADRNILEDIRIARRLFVDDPKLIKFKFSGDSSIQLRQGGRRRQAELLVFTAEFLLHGRRPDIHCGNCGMLLAARTCLS